MTPNLAADITDRLKKLFPSPVSLSEPFFDKKDEDIVKECVSSGWVSSAGNFIETFEKNLAEHQEIPYAVACVNGTSALHISLLLAGVKKDEEVLIPSFSFVATANAVNYCGAIPHFIDIEEAHMGIDSKKLKDYLANQTNLKADGYYNKKTGRRISAVVPMHTFGNPVDMHPLLEVAKEFRLPVVEDCAESIGSVYHGKKTGSFGLLSAFSFNGNKIVTTGGGGAILTKDAALAKKAKHLTTTSKVSHPWAFDHDEVGYNYRLPNLNAALGVSQLEKLPMLLTARKKLFNTYREAFSNFRGAKLYKYPQHGDPNHWMIALLLDHPDLKLRDTVLNLTNQAGIQTRPAWNLLHTLRMYSSAPKMDLSCSLQLFQRVVNIPSSSHLGFHHAKT